MEHRRCIFHIPNALDENGSSGSQVRPRKMLQAFKNIGYEVDAVMGYGRDRTIQIEKIRQNILNGVKYDFVYSENSTMPTLLTEKDHMPRFPFLDFGFFKFCKRHDIPIGLFYRDIHWRFPVYRENVHGLRYYVAQAAYRYDLHEYVKYLDVFYVPNKKISKYVRNKRLDAIMDELPPGSVYDPGFVEYKKLFYENRLKHYDGKIKLFYVGGLGNQYIFDALLEGVYTLENIDVTICCREKEWADNKPRLEKYLTDRIHVVHKTGAELEAHYREADISLAYFKPGQYIDMAIPIKLFEYIAHATPVLATEGTATGGFVAENGTGWSIGYDAQEVRDLLESLLGNYREVVDMHRKCLAALDENTWEGRARRVRDRLVKATV